jgi:hypothetical protein
LGERLDRTQEVAGSSPASSTSKALETGPFFVAARPNGKLLLDQKRGTVERSNRGHGEDDRVSRTDPADARGRDHFPRFARPGATYQIRVIARDGSNNALLILFRRKHGRDRGRGWVTRTAGVGGPLWTPTP